MAAAVTNTITLFKETANQRWERETLEVWLSAKQRLFVKSELRLPKGEKSKPRKKVVKNEEAEMVTEMVETSEMDLKEIGQHNYDILIRKLSANLARKV